MGKPPEVKGVTPKKIFQKINSEDLFETDLEFEPTYVPWVYIDNIISRVLARLVGQGPYGPVVVKCTADGSIATVPRGGAFDDYQKHEYDFEGLPSGSATSTLADHLVDSAATFVTDGVQVGDTVKNTTDDTYALVTLVNTDTDLTIDTNIMESGEAYEVRPHVELTFSQQVNRIDLFTYGGKVDYQLTRDAVKAYGDKLELFEDSFYSLDFNTLKIKATLSTWTAATPTRVKAVGWFREGG